MKSKLHNGRDMLELVLQAIQQIQFCRAAPADPDILTKYPSYHPVDAMVGECDWIAELHTLLEEAVKLSNEDPNSYMFGGQHYRQANPHYQHWDMAADYGLNYFTSAATKYVSRWRHKDGLKDVQKAGHYIAKLKSLYEEARGPYVWSVRQAEAPTLDDRLLRWCEEQQLTPQETDIVVLAVTYRNLHDLDRLTVMIEHLCQHAASYGNPRRPVGSPQVAGQGQP